jgi:hypothetical protein
MANTFAYYDTATITAIRVLYYLAGPRERYMSNLAWLKKVFQEQTL